MSLISVRHQGTPDCLHTETGLPFFSDVLSGVRFQTTRSNHEGRTWPAPDEDLQNVTGARLLGSDLSAGQLVVAPGIGYGNERVVGTCSSNQSTMELQFWFVSLVHFKLLQGASVPLLKKGEIHGT